MTDIISVKIANRVLTPELSTPTGLSLFPFERIYLTKTPQIVPRIFRYYLSMPLTSTLLDGLNRVKVHTQKDKGLERPTQNAAVKKGGASNGFADFNLDDRWTLIVPTRTQSKVKNTNIIQLLDYVMIHCPPRHNHNPDLPGITLHTPKGDTSLLCARCTNISKMYDNLCSPGTNACTRSRQIILTATPVKYDLKGAAVTK